MIIEVALPLLAMGVAGWLVPWALGRLLPEGAWWLVFNAVLSTILLAAGAGVGFLLLYGEAGGVVWGTAPGHVVALAARSALVWAPLMVLSLANLPRGWTRARW